MEAFLIRTKSNSTQTTGKFLVYDYDRKIAEFASVELPWKNNKRGVSCIPDGEYQCLPRTTGKYAGRAFHVRSIGSDEVVGRTHILIHPANFAHELEGCIAIGMRATDIDGDGNIDVASSVAAVEKLQSIVSNFTLRVITL